MKDFRYEINCYHYYPEVEFDKETNSWKISLVSNDSEFMPCFATAKGETRSIAYRNLEKELDQMGIVYGEPNTFIPFSEIDNWEKERIIIEAKKVKRLMDKEYTYYSGYDKEDKKYEEFRRRMLSWTSKFAHYNSFVPRDIYESL